MVQVIAGAEGLLAPAAAQITDAVVKYMDPNREFRETMRGVVASNPELLQSLANLEAGSPGSLEALGFGSLGEVIRQTPESVESRVGRDPTYRAATERNLRAAPDMARRGAEAELTSREADATVSTNQAELSEARQEGELINAGIDFTNAVARRNYINERGGARNFEGLANVNLMDAARSMLNGRRPERLNEILAVPEAAQEFSLMISAIESERQEAHRRTMEANSRGNALEEIAGRAFMNTGMAGSMNTWRDYLTNSDTRARAAELINEDRNSLSQADRDLFDVHYAHRMSTATENAQQANTLLIGLNRALGAVQTEVSQGADPARMDATLAGLQEVIDARSAFTGQSYVAHYGQIPGEERHFSRDPRGIYFTPIGDPETVVPLTEVMRPVSPVPEQQLNTLARQKLMEIMAMPPDARQAEIDRGREVDAELANMVQIQYNRFLRESAD